MSSRGMPVTRAIKLFRRKNAEARQAEYDKLSIKEKLERLPPEPHAKRQRAKLTALLNAPKSSSKNTEAPIVELHVSGVVVHNHPTPEEMGVDAAELTKKNKKRLNDLKKGSK